jgi:hypothetical protein
MMQTSLLILLELNEHSDELNFTIVNSIGRGYHYCKVDNVSRTELWMIPTARKEKNEIINQLTAIEAVKNLSLVIIENSTKSTDLPAVRQLFEAYGWDAGSVSDEKLLLYLNSTFQLQSTYYIDFEPGEPGAKSQRIIIKPNKENPGYSARDSEKIKKWMLNEKEIASGSFRNVSAISYHTVEIKKGLPLQEVRHLNDVQIRKWILKHDTDLKNEDIQIERTPGTIKITIKSDNGTTTFQAFDLK